MGTTWLRLLAFAGVAVVTLSATLLLLAAARIVVSNFRDRRRAALEQELRPLLVRTIIDDELDVGLARQQGARGETLERMAVDELRKLKGEARAKLARLLRSRRTMVRARRSARRWRSTKRAGAALIFAAVADKESLPELQRLLLEDRDGEVRIVATRALGELRDKGAVTTLVSAAEQGRVPWGVAKAALFAIGQSAIEGLKAALRSPDQRTRMFSVDLLGLLNALPAIPDLLEALHDGALEVRVAAARALGRIGAPRAVPGLVACLLVSEPPELRAVAAEALGRIGASETVDALAGLLGDTDFSIAHNAAQALARISAEGRRRLEELVARLGSGADHGREALAGARLRERHGGGSFPRAASIGSWPVLPVRSGSRSP